VTASRGERIRVAQIIARLNIGGSAIQAITLTQRLAPLGYEALLIRGSEGPREGSLDDLAEELGVRPLRIARMRREVGVRDLAALARLVRELRSFRADVVHTHAAKAGTLGRLAALVPGRGRPRVTVHTFHGHSLRGYFSPRRAALFLRVERVLAKRTTRLIAVSDEVRDELVALGVAPVERFEVIQLGLDLSRFVVGEAERARRGARLRASLGIPPEARVVTLVARLVPIKRVDRFLAIAQRLAGELDDVWFLIAGDGELGDRLRALPQPARTVWAGFQRDVAAVCFASDVVVLTSDNEGTPVSLIEAQAAGVPVVSTRVGGAAAVVAPGSGALVRPDDEEGFARAVRTVLERASPVGDPRAHVLQTFSLDRLVADIDELYRRLLAQAP